MPDHQPTVDRWRRRPGLARLYRAYALMGPLVTLLTVAFFCIQLLPTAGSAPGAVVRWLLIAVLSLGAALLTERALHGLLVVASLLDLDLGFPGAVPTRTRIASLASLPGAGHERVRRSPAVGDGEVARGELDVAAEHAVTRYGAMMGGGLQPRTHLSRVRAVAALMVGELHLPIGDRDRLEWALLLREIGTSTDDPAHVHRPVVEWLGPWSALIQGPFIATATRTSSPRVAWAAHVAAVADAYVVLTAAHPYERSLLGGNRLPFEALAAQRLSVQAVEALLAVPVPARRRAAGFTSGVASSIVHRSPRPRPAFALMSLLIVAALAAGGVGAPQPTGLPGEVVAAGGDTARRGAVAQRAAELPDPDTAPATRRVGIAGQPEGGTRTPTADEPQARRAPARSTRSWTTTAARTYPGTPRGGGDAGAVAASEISAGATATSAPSAGASAPSPTPQPGPTSPPTPQPGPTSPPTPQPVPTSSPTPQPGPQPDPQPTSEPAAGDEAAGGDASPSASGSEPTP